MARKRKAITDPTVTFWGATRTVTGSMHQLDARGQTLLLDCGLFQGHREESRQRNRTFPFRPRDIDAVVLSHAHIDHCGNLPNLVKQGFTGPIYCTAATRDLLSVILTDSARFQEEETFVLNVIGQGESPGAQSLYGRSDAGQVLRQCVAVPYDVPREIFPGLELRLVEAGHILGSAMVSLRLEHAGRECGVTFTGDLGRRGLPFVRPTAPV